MIDFLITIDFGFRWFTRFDTIFFGSKNSFKIKIITCQRILMKVKFDISYNNSIIKVMKMLQNYYWDKKNNGDQETMLEGLESIKK